MIVGGIGMGNIATYLSPVSHYRVGYPGRGIIQNRVAVADERRGIQFRLASERTDVQHAIRLLEIVQARDAVDVNQDRRFSKAETQKGNEAMATSEDFGFIASLVQYGNSPRDGVRRDVFEGTRNQSITSNSCRRAT